MKPRFAILLLILLLVLMSLFVLFPFFTQNSLLSADMPGHVYDAWFTKTELWPAMTGWNPEFYAGYPHHQFYPGLYAWVVALFSFVLPLEIAFKLVLSMAILITPLSFYYCARRFKYTELQSVTIAALMTSALFIPYRYITGNYAPGATFVSTFNVGLVTNALALPLLFFYIGALHGAFKTKKYILVSVLMALLVFTHVYIALIAALGFIAYAVILLRKKHDILFAAKHILLTFGVTAFWVIPFLLTAGASNFVYIYLPLTKTTIGVILLSLALMGWLIHTKQDEDIFPVISFFFVLLFFVLIGNLMSIPMHVYRLMLLAYLIVPFFLVKALSHKYALATYWIIAVIIASVFYSTINLHGPEPINIPDIVLPEGRYYVISLPQYLQGHHSLRHLLPMHVQNDGSIGLLVESANNGRYFQEFGKLVDPREHEWGIWLSWSALRNLSAQEKQSLILSRAQMLNINTIISPVEPQVPYEASYPVFAVNDTQRFWILENQYVPIQSGSKYVVFLNTTAFSIDYYGNRYVEYAVNETPTEDIITFDANDSMLLKRYDTYYVPVLNGTPAQRITGEIITQGFLPSWNQTATKNISVQYVAYVIGNSSLIDVLDYAPETISKNWTDKVNAWWLNANETKVYVHTDDKLPEYIGVGNEIVTILEKEREYIRFNVEAEHSVPILIKMSYFPYWKAYVNGEKTEIYEVSPHLMIVYGRGMVEMRYDLPFITIVSLFLSLFFLFLILSWTVQKSNNRPKRNNNKKLSDGIINQ